MCCVAPDPEPACDYVAGAPRTAQTVLTGRAVLRYQRATTIKDARRAKLRKSASLISPVERTTKMNRFGSGLVAGLAVAGFMGAAPAARAQDAAAAEALARKSGCLKCHSVTQKKDAPAYKEVAAKYKGQADAEKKIIAFISTNAKIKVDGKEEEHDALKTKNEAEVQNVAKWILSR
jgi:cytochrome c